MQFDIDDIKNKFNKVLAYSQEGLTNPQTDELFDKWLEAKRDFIEAFGGKLIIELPEEISFDLDEESKAQKLVDFTTLLSTKYNAFDLAKFIQKNEQGFYANQVINDYTLADGTIINKGMKLVKAFKFFIKNEKILNEIQSAASMIIQENKITGKLCFSVHPLDFLSSSENTHNWRSCHALDGEYRSGNISYMVDESTFMCYLKSKKDTILPSFPEDVPWNSKKWRVLMFVDKNWEIMFAGRQYPFTTTTGIEYVRKCITAHILRKTMSSWFSVKDTNIPEYIYNTNNPSDCFWGPSSPVVFDDVIYPLKDIVKSGEGALNYNDLLSSTCYIPMYCVAAKASPHPDNKRYWYRPRFTQNKVTPIVKVGGGCNCLRCNTSPINLTESFMCDTCEMQYGAADADIFATCSWCGERFIYDDGYWIEDEDVMICDYCASHEAVYCAACDTLTNRSHYIEEGIYLCANCAEGGY